jgi:hypothetical protein
MTHLFVGDGDHGGENDPCDNFVTGWSGERTLVSVIRVQLRRQQ